MVGDRVGDTEDRFGELCLEQEHQISVLECTVGLVKKTCQRACFINQFWATSSETFAAWANFLIAAIPLPIPLRAVINFCQPIENARAHCIPYTIKKMYDPFGCLQGKKISSKTIQDILQKKKWIIHASANKKNWSLSFMRGAISLCGEWVLSWMSKML